MPTTYHRCVRIVKRHDNSLFPFVGVPGSYIRLSCSLWNSTREAFESSTSSGSNWSRMMRVRFPAPEEQGAQRPHKRCRLLPIVQDKGIGESRACSDLPRDQYSGTHRPMSMSGDLIRITADAAADLLSKGVSSCFILHPCSDGGEMP